MIKSTKDSRHCPNKSCTCICFWFECVWGGKCVRGVPGTYCATNCRQRASPRPKLCSMLQLHDVVEAQRWLSGGRATEENKPHTHPKSPNTHHDSRAKCRHRNNTHHHNNIDNYTPQQHEHPALPKSAMPATPHTHTTHNGNTNDIRRNTCQKHGPQGTPNRPHGATQQISVDDGDCDGDDEGDDNTLKTSTTTTATKPPTPMMTTTKTTRATARTTPTTSKGKERTLNPLSKDLSDAYHPLIPDFAPLTPRIEHRVRSGLR